MVTKDCGISIVEISPTAMRAPKRRRPLANRLGPLPDEADLTSVAERARYIGSPEHKDIPSFAGHPRPRSDASICPRELTQEQVQSWLRDAILRGAVSPLWEGEFPRYVWFKAGELAYQGRLVNSGTGGYKGWPITRDEWPVGLDTLYD